jgi:hypothetical protein
LKKDQWEVFFRVGKMFSKGELKRMDCGKKKRTRSTKEREIKEHQVTSNSVNLNFHLFNIDINFSIAFFRYFG